MVLEFKVHEQTIEAIASNVIPRRKSREYLHLKFYFADDWMNYIKTVYFQYEEDSEPIVLDDTSEVIVPNYFAQHDHFLVMLVGIDGDVSCPTNVLCITLDESGTVWTQVPPDTDMPAYQQLVMLAQEAEHAADHASEDAARAMEAAQAAAEAVEAVSPTHLTWDAEQYPELIDFLRSITEVGKYEFRRNIDDAYQYQYELTVSDNGVDREYYGFLRGYTADETVLDYRTYIGPPGTEWFFEEPSLALIKREDLDNALTAKQNKSERQTSIPDNADNNHYPTSKAVADYVRSHGGGGGTDDHRQLTHRNDPNQHPISAIEGLQAELNGKQDKLTAGDGISIDANNVISATGGSGDSVFVATYGQTTLSEIVAAYNAKESVICNYGNRQYRLYSATVTIAIFTTIEVSSYKIQHRLSVNAQNAWSVANVDLSETLIVTADFDEVNMTILNASHTFAEIAAAYDAQKVVFLRSGYYEMEATAKTRTAVQFTAPLGTEAFAVTVRNSGVWSVNKIEMVTVIVDNPTNLQYPSALAVVNYVNSVIGNISAALSAMDAVIGGDEP